jgi:hypothetical protein
MLGFIDRRRRQSRWVAGAVAVLQLVAVTWVPVVHPYIHPDTPPPTPANEFTDQADNTALGSGVETSCFICAAGHSFSAAIDERLPLNAGVPWRLLFNSAVHRPILHTDTPANAARAPPTSS